MKQCNNMNMIGIVPIEKSDNEIYCLDVPKTDVIALNLMQLRLLLPGKENKERLKTVLDGQQFKRALNAEKGDIVLLKPEFWNVEHDMKYNIIKDVSLYGIALSFCVSFKVRQNLFNLRKYSAKICLFKVSNRNIKRSEICLRLTIKISEQHHGRPFGVFIGSFEHISYFFQVFLLLVLNKYMFAGQ